MWTHSYMVDIYNICIHIHIDVKINIYDVTDKLLNCNISRIILSIFSLNLSFGLAFPSLSHHLFVVYPRK